MKKTTKDQSSPASPAALPAGSRLVPLGEVCETTSGGTPSRRHPEYYNGPIPWVKSGELNYNVITDTEEKISEEAIKNSSAKIFPKGTLLIALYGATIGKLAQLGIDAATNQAVCGIFESEQVSTKFLYHYLFYKRPSLVKEGVGGAQPNISQTILKNLLIPLPPLPQQVRIVARIEALFSQLDKGQQALRLAQQQLARYRQSVLHAAFRGALTGPTAPNGDLPEGWEWKKLGEVCALIGGVTKGRKLDGKKTISLPYLRVANVQDGYLNLDEIKYIDVLESDLEKYQLLKDDLLFTEGGDKDKLGRGSIWNGEIENCIHQNHIFRGRPDLDLVIPKFVTYYTQSRSAKDYFYKNAKQTVNLASINLRVLSNLPFPLPSLSGQRRIVAEIERRLTIADQLQQTLSTSLHQSQLLRQSILQQAFQGQWVGEEEEV
jgi:type I restriction enzyme S subunit